MTDAMTSQNIDLFSWDILYTVMNLQRAQKDANLKKSERILDA
jgi:hypothetical protein